MTTEPEAPPAPETVAAPARAASSSRWLAWGTGAAIEIRPSELLVAVVRTRPSGATLLGAARIPDYRTRPAAEWGAELATFLRRHGAGHIAVTALLPRSEVIVRLVALPGVSPRDTEAAIRLQLDSLHPFSDEDAVFSWARLPKSPEVLVGIARRETVDSWSTLFAEAGVKLALGRLNASLALFRTTLPSAFAVPDDDAPGLFRFGLFGKQRNQGVELTFDGELTRTLRVIAGASILDARLRETPDH